MQRICVHSVQMQKYSLNKGDGFLTFTYNNNRTIWMRGDLRIYYAVAPFAKVRCALQFTFFSVAQKEIGILFLHIGYNNYFTKDKVKCHFIEGMTN